MWIYTHVCLCVYRYRYICIYMHGLDSKHIRVTVHRHLRTYIQFASMYSSFNIHACTHWHVQNTCIYTYKYRCAHVCNTHMSIKIFSNLLNTRYKRHISRFPFAMSMSFCFHGHRMTWRLEVCNSWWRTPQKTSKPWRCVPSSRSEISSEISIGISIGSLEISIDL